MNFKHTYETQKAARDRFISALNPKSFDFQITTWFGSGLIVPAPGTWGTIGGMIFGILLLFLTNSLVVFIAAVILFFVGLRSVARIEKQLSDHDPSFIVIDEVVAILLLFSVIPNNDNYWILMLNFILFRIFDAWKPFPINWVDKKINGAWGVMLDDIIAAIFSYIVFYILFILISFI